MVILPRVKLLEKEDIVVLVAVKSVLQAPGYLVKAWAANVNQSMYRHHIINVINLNDRNDT